MMANVMKFIRGGLFDFLRVLAAGGAIWLAAWYYDRQMLSVVATIVCLIGFLGVTLCIMLENYVEKKTRVLEILRVLAEHDGDHQRASLLGNIGNTRWLAVVCTAVCTVLAAQLGKLEVEGNIALQFIFLMIITVGLINIITTYLLLKLISIKLRLARKWSKKDDD